MHPEQSILFASFRIDFVNECLWHDTRALPLTPKAFAVLRHLAGHPDLLVTKEELLKAIWPETYVGDAVLKVCVREIRKVLGDNPQVPQFIETVHRRGYRFIAPITAPQLMASSRYSVANSQKQPSVQSLESRSQQQIPEPFPSPHDPTPRLVGRETALAQLHSHFALMLKGERQVVFVTGEAGIGKTTLVDVFLKQALTTTRLWIARGQCVEQYGVGEAYLPVFEGLSHLCHPPQGEYFSSLLRRYAPTWLVQMPWLLSPADREGLQHEILGATRERMLREMAEAIEVLTTEVPFVLVLEDLHWSDYATLDLFASLAHRRETARLLLIGTYRPTEVIVSGHPLKSVKQDLQLHRRCTELPLEFLSEADVATYLTQRFAIQERQAALLQRLVRLIHQRTNGNPLFMVNVVDYLLAQGVLVQGKEGWECRDKVEAADLGVPESIQQMIEKQFERLSGEEQQLLEAASVVGMEFSLAAVAAALDKEIGQIEECCEGLVRRQHFLYSRGVEDWPNGIVAGRYEFSHSLYQHVLYRRISVTRRMRLHQQIGKWIEEVYGERRGEVAGELAIHFEHGRNYGRAVQYLRQAAENAVRRSANDEAIHYLIRALELVERLPEAERTPLHLAIREQLGLARRSVGDLKGAFGDFATLTAYARAQGQIEWEVKSLLLSASTLSWIDHEQCLAIAEQAVALSWNLADETLQIHARAYYGYWHSLLHGWRDEDAQMCAQAVKLARRMENSALLGLHVGRHLYFQCIRSTYRAACRAAEEEVHVGLTVGDAHHYMTCQFFHAWALLHLGQWGEMLAVLKDGEQIADKNQHHIWGMAFRLERAWLYEQACDFARTRELSEQGFIQAQEAHHQYGKPLSLILLGRAHLGLHEYEQAFQRLSAITHQQEHTVMDWILRLLLHYSLSEYWLAQKKFTLARQQAEQLCALAAQPGERTYLALGRQILAQIALAQRQWNQAEKEISQALAVLEGAEAPLAEWRVYATAAQFQQRRRRATEANHYWTRSAAILHQLADSVGNAIELRQSLLSSPFAKTILRHVRASTEY